MTKERGYFIMKNYEKPMVMVNEGLAEGVYAASGDCWSLEAYVADTNGVIQIDAHHENLEPHNSAITITITFNQDVEVVDNGGARSASASGNSATFTWDVGTANPGEDKGFSARVSCADLVNLKITGTTWSCGCL